MFSQPDDLVYLENASGTTPIFCSDVVVWQTEYRVFVIHSDIVGIRHYAGDPELQTDHSVARNAIELLEQSGEATAAYAIDLGVTDNGQTALVEWNDGFSLAAYGLAQNIYTDLIIARWSELVQ